MFVLTGCASSTAPISEQQTKSVTLTQAEKDLGIDIQAIRLSAGGYILDFRYKAIDPEKANILFSREIQPYLLHEATGGVLTVPTTAKIGPLRNTTNQPVAGKIYFMLFGNAGKYVKAGDKVTVIFGDYRMEHLTVE
jgi:hypothetical protein